MDTSNPRVIQGLTVRMHTHTHTHFYLRQPNLPTIV